MIEGDSEATCPGRNAGTALKQTDLRVCTGAGEMTILAASDAYKTGKLKQP